MGSAQKFVGREYPWLPEGGIQRASSEKFGKNIKQRLEDLPCGVIVM